MSMRRGGWARATLECIFPLSLSFVLFFSFVYFFWRHMGEGRCGCPTKTVW